jgi:hypothetical protein
MARSKRSQSKHNTTVKKLAEQYKQKGYKVKADIEGWGKPDTIKGVRPDIIAEKSGHKTVVDVETKDSVDNKRDLQQQKTFKNWSSNSDKKHYKRVVTEK